MPSATKPAAELATTLLRNCTVSGNFASLNGTNTGGGVINQGTATQSRIRLENTIVAANMADDGSPDVAGAIVSGGYNLVGDGHRSTGLTNGVNNDQVGTGAFAHQSTARPLAGQRRPYRHARVVVEQPGARFSEQRHRSA